MQEVFFTILVAWLVYKIFSSVNASNRSGESRMPKKGETKVEYIPPKTDKKPGTSKGGEYVDYEELE